MRATPPTTATTEPDFDSLAAGFPVLVGVTAEDVVHTERRLGETVAVIDTWEFGAQWAQLSNTTDLIVVDVATWESLSDAGRDYLVAHERHERDAARNALDILTTDLSPHEIVGEFHNEANRRAVDEVGPAAATTYAQETFDRTGERIDATYVLCGVEHLVPEDIRTDLPPQLQ